MSEDQKRILEQQLWNIANTLRGKMNADELNEQVKRKIIKAKNEK